MGPERGDTNTYSLGAGRAWQPTVRATSTICLFNSKFRHNFQVNEMIMMMMTMTVCVPSAMCAIRYVAGPPSHALSVAPSSLAIFNRL